jgi:hypothetical protein
MAKCLSAGYPSTRRPAIQGETGNGKNSWRGRPTRGQIGHTGRSSTQTAKLSHPCCSLSRCLLTKEGCLRVHQGRLTMRFENNPLGPPLKVADPVASSHQRWAKLGFEQIVGSSSALAAVLAEVERVAPADFRNRPIYHYHFASLLSNYLGLCIG